MSELKLSERIRKYSIALANKIFPDYKPTKREQVVCDSIFRILEDPNTNKIIWENDFILMDGGESMVKLNGGDLSLISPVGNICLQCSTSFIDYLRKEISKILSERISELEKVFEQRELSVLEAINTTSYKPGRKDK